MKGSGMLLCGMLFLSIFLLQVVHAENKNVTSYESTCNQAECLRCNLEAAQCVKCLYVILEDTRQCLRNCPQGFEPIWSRSADIVGRLCAERSVLSLVSQRQVGIIAGASLLGAICVGIFLGILVLHKKGAKSPPGSPPRAIPRSLQDKRPKTEEINLKGKEKEEFLNRVRFLRADAPHIFRMMAETRNRFKGGSGPDNPSETRTKACKAVVRDLSRVLCILSRKEEHLKTAPKDWDRLLAWTERFLVRYKRQQELKDLIDSGAGDSPSPTGNGRHLFVTRQEKVQEERRRWIERTPSNEKPQKLKNEFNFNEDLDFTVDAFDFSFNDDDEIKNSDQESIPDSPPPKMALTPLNSTESLLPKPSPTGKRKRKKDLLNFNKQIWSKLSTFKDNEKPSLTLDVERASEKRYEDLEVSLTNDDIFDHIEAFAFDLPSDTVEEINESSRNGQRYKKTGKNDIKNIDSIWKEPFRPKKINVKDLNSINLNQPPRSRINKTKNSINKENRPSRIRRISSSLLRKDRKLIATPKEDSGKLGLKKRRPIMRQKQVEKDKSSVIREKLRKSCSVDSDPSLIAKVHSPFERQTSEVPRIERRSSEVPRLECETSTVNQIIEGDDVYLQITKTPVLGHRVKKFSSVYLNRNQIDPGICEKNRSSDSFLGSDSCNNRPYSPSLSVDSTSSDSSTFDHLDFRRGKEERNDHNDKDPKVQKETEKIDNSNQDDINSPKNIHSRCEILTDV